MITIQRAFLIAIFFIGIAINGQSGFNPKIDKDSLFESILKTIPENKMKNDLKSSFYNANSEGKEYLLAVLYDSNYTKEDLIENFIKNENKILKFKDEYSKLVPKNLIVHTSISTNKIFIPEKVITIKIYEINNHYTNNRILDDKSNLKLVGNCDQLFYGTEEMENVLNLLQWDENILKSIETKLEEINSFSIRNGDPTLIQFKRIGIGFISYKVFDKNLTDQEIIENNDGCNHLYYKNNIVFVSDNGQDGARGALCFPE